MLGAGDQVAGLARPVGERARRAPGGRPRRPRDRSVVSPRQPDSIDGDEIDDRAAAQRILDEMGARTEPQIDLGLASARAGDRRARSRGTRRGRKTACRRARRGPSRSRTRERSPSAPIDEVAALAQRQRSALQRRARRRRRVSATPATSKPRRRSTPARASATSASALLQIGAMDDEIGRAPALFGVAQRQARELGIVAPAPDADRARRASPAR